MLSRSEPGMAQEAHYLNADVRLSAFRSKNAAVSMIWM
jgi:hypothetical protein